VKQKFVAGLIGVVAVATCFTSAALASTPQVVTAKAVLFSNPSKHRPLMRITFPQAVKASALPELQTTPALTTKWVQLSASVVEAFITGAMPSPFGYSVNVPASYQCASGGCTLNASTPQLTTQHNTLPWAAQLLAELKYLPLAFVPTVVSSNPAVWVPGHFVWKYSLLTSNLQSQWSTTRPSVVLTGAVMNFQNTLGLPVTGVVDPPTWTALLSAALHHKYDPVAYNYVRVSQVVPETLTLYIAGRPVYKSLVNTGIPGATTAPGTYPVYLRYVTTTMRGTSPNGTPYNDTGIPWVSYFNGGDALHGFIRSSYGTPQSLGCVEMPFANAGKVWPHTPLGTLVTILP